ncbi:hypothetical protein [Prochlorococcus sp. MIT 1300]|uniref:hypothetical protein n=1 Tax=Prochlorococcus sp. MIT 1300 TaxID=3096218 RepID=UPI002A766908|nr:hypothetical protein [Prochlorococcus sp. MIT 1300]
MRSYIQEQFSSIHIQKILIIIIAIIFPILIGVSPAKTESLKWKEVPSSEFGHQWWDTESLMKDNDENLSILTKFIPKGDSESREKQAILYGMNINCSNRTFKDISVNGAPELIQNWRSAQGDILIEGVIKDVCMPQTEKKT